MAKLGFKKRPVIGRVKTEERARHYGGMRDARVALYRRRRATPPQ